MTLILSAVCGRWAFHASDRFVSVKKTPKNPTGEHDPHSNKTVVVVGSDCWVVIGYTGLAYLNGRPTDQLIAEVLSGREDLSSAGIGGWYQPNLHYREIRDRIEAAICDAYMRLSLEEQKYSTTVLTAGVQRKGEGIQHVMFIVEVSQNGSRCTEFTNAHRRELLTRPWFNRFHVDAVGTRIGWLGALTALRLSLYTRVARPPTTSAEKFREGFRDILMYEVAATAILSDVVGRDVMGVILDGPANTVHTHFRRAEHEKHAQLLERIYQGLGDAANHLPDDLPAMPTPFVLGRSMLWTPSVGTGGWTEVGTGFEYRVTGLPEPERKPGERSGGFFSSQQDQRGRYRSR